MNIGTIAKRSGLPAKTIRYYESIGLIPPALRSEGNYRTYSEHDLQTLKFVQRARGLGFSVKDVAKLLTLWQDRRRASAEVRRLAQEHVSENATATTGRTARFSTISQAPSATRTKAPGRMGRAARCGALTA